MYEVEWDDRSRASDSVKPAFSPTEQEYNILVQRHPTMLYGVGCVHTDLSVFSQSNPGSAKFFELTNTCMDPPFRLQGTRRTVYVFQQQLIEFARFRVDGLHK